jgi:hypothetical protein
MEAEGGETEHSVNVLKALAFSLLRFHPVTENDNGGAWVSPSGPT